MFQTKVVEKIKTRFIINTSFFFSEKSWRPQKTIWRMRIALWIPKATKNTLRLCNINCLSTPTMVAGTLLIATLDVHCLSCLCIVTWRKSIFLFEFDVNYRYSIRSITTLQTGRSRVRFPMVSLEFFSDIILPVAPWPWDRLSL